MSNKEDSSAALEIVVAEDIVSNPPGTPPEDTTIQEADSTRWKVYSIQYRLTVKLQKPKKRLGSPDTLIITTKVLEVNLPGYKARTKINPPTNCVTNMIIWLKAEKVRKGIQSTFASTLS